MYRGIETRRVKCLLQTNKAERKKKKTVEVKVLCRKKSNQGQNRKQREERASLSPAAPHAFTRRSLFP